MNKLAALGIFAVAVVLVLIVVLMSGFNANIGGKDYAVKLENWALSIAEQGGDEAVGGQDGAQASLDGKKEEIKPAANPNENPASQENMAGDASGAGSQGSAVQNPDGGMVPLDNAGDASKPAEIPVEVPAAPVKAGAEQVCGDGVLGSGEECDLGTKGTPGQYECVDGSYCSNCKCYTGAEPIGCTANHKYYASTGLNDFIWTTLPVCSDDCAELFGFDYKCDVRTCTCVPKDVTSHTCGNNIKESIEECDGYDDQWCDSDHVCGPDCACVKGTRGVCGDGVRAVNEQCEKNDISMCKANQECNYLCRCVDVQAAPSAACGNNVREGSEQCD